MVIYLELIWIRDIVYIKENLIFFFINSFLFVKLIYKKEIFYFFLIFDGGINVCCYVYLFNYL